MQNGNNSIDLRWHVLLCEPMRELVAARRLRRMKLDAYVPVVKGRTHRHRPKDIARAMFPGYLFLALDHAWAFGELYLVPGLRTGEQRTTSPFLRINSVPATISDEAIALIRTVEAAIADPKNPIGAPFKVGDMVQFSSGPFAGKLARVAEMSNPERIELLMDLVNRAIRITAPVRQVEPETVFVRP